MTVSIISCLLGYGSSSMSFKQFKYLQIEIKLITTLFQGEEQGVGEGDGYASEVVECTLQFSDNGALSSQFEMLIGVLYWRFL